MPFTDSATVTAQLPIRGVWIHDPDSPDATARNFEFGANQRSDTYDPMGDGSYFAGRRFPVFDYGDAEAQTVDYTVDIPHGLGYAQSLSLLRTFASNRRPVWVRDNRGRATYGTIGPMRTNDMAWGSQVSFVVTAADRVIVEATS